MNNAGLLSASNRRTEDGLELMFAINHLSYFVLSNLLLERLRAAAGARIVSTASKPIGAPGSTSTACRIRRE